MVVDRTRLPAVHPPEAFVPPSFTRTATSSGVDLWTVSHRRAPVLTLRLLIPVGSADDPEGETGLAALTADLLDEGTRDRSDVDLHQALMAIGAHLSVEASSDATVVSLSTLAKHAREALALLVEVVTQPRFDPDDCERVRTLRLTRLRQMTHAPSAVATRVFLESLYPGHPYGHLPIGREDDLRRLGVDQVSAFHRGRYGPERWTLVAVGDLTDEELQGLATEALRLPTTIGSERPSLTRPSPPSPVARLVFVPRPNAVQSEIRLGHPIVARSSPDYYPLLVLNMVLGGQFVSRINTNLREDKGYTYGARTAIDWRVGEGPFSFQSSVQTDATADAIREVIRELREVRGSRPVTDAELAMARAALVGGFPRGFETASQVARAGTTLALHGLPPDEMARLVARVEAVDLEAVGRVAEAHLHPDRVLAVVVGSESDVVPSLDGLDLGTPVLAS